MVLCWVKGAHRHLFSEDKNCSKGDHIRWTNYFCGVKQKFKCDVSFGIRCKGTSSHIPRPGLGMRLELLCKNGRVSSTSICSQFQYDRKLQLRLKYRRCTAAIRLTYSWFPGPISILGPTPVLGPTLLLGPTPVPGPTLLLGPTPVPGPTLLLGPTPVPGPTLLLGPTLLPSLTVHLLTRVTLR